MGIEEDFYATLKFKNGEEIFAKVAASEEGERTLLIISNPIVVNKIKNKLGTVGYKIEPWLKTTTEDMFILNLEDVLTISESFDVEMIMLYQNYIRQSSKERGNHSQITRRMGYIANVNDAKEILEKLYKNS